MRKHVLGIVSYDVTTIEFHHFLIIMLLLNYKEYLFQLPWPYGSHNESRALLALSYSVLSQYLRSLISKHQFHHISINRFNWYNIQDQINFTELLEFARSLWGDWVVGRGCRWAGTLVPWWVLSVHHCQLLHDKMWNLC